MRLTVIFVMLLAYSETRLNKNVLLIISDDEGFEMGAYGNTLCQTPNLDALARRSLIFSHARTSVSSCSPSRASLLTGLPAHQNGLYGLHHDIHHFNSFEKVKSLPGILREHGVYTGKTFPYWQKEYFVLKRPFLLYIAFHDPHRCDHSNAHFGHFCEKFGNGEPEYGTIPDWIPTLYDPENVRVPYFVPNTLEARKDIAAQYTSISRLDQGVGLILEELRKAGHEENTLIIYSSDNGVSFPCGRTNMYEPGLSVPFFLSSPFHKGKVGQKTEEQVSLLDVVPTILDWFEIDFPKYHILKPSQPTLLPGRSLLPLLTANVTESHSEVFFASHVVHEVTMYYPMRAIVLGERFKLIHNLITKGTVFPIDQDFYLSPTFLDILNRTKSGLPLHWYKSLDEYYYREEWELYDLKNDPQERFNLQHKKKYKDILFDLKKRLFDWQLATYDPWLCSPHGVLIVSQTNFSCLPLYN